MRCTFCYGVLEQRSLHACETQLCLRPVSRLLQEWAVFNDNSGMIIGVNMPFGIKIGLGPVVIGGTEVRRGGRWGQNGMY